MNHIARLQHLHYCARLGIRHFHLRHGLMEIMIEFLPDRVDPLDALPREHALRCALAGGDDYEVAFAAPPAS